MKYLIIPIILFVFSCSDSGKKENITNDSTHTSGTISPKKLYDTITKLSDFKGTDTVIFKAPNGYCYLEYKEVDEDTLVASNSNLEMKKTTLALSAGGTCDSEKFDGSDRKAAKISLASGEFEKYDNLKQLLDVLKDDQEIADKILTTGPASNRVKDEKINVNIKTAWLYTFKRQTDEDFHLILGTTKNIKTAKFFNVEISGLPATNAANYSQIKNARDQFYDFFNFSKDECAGTSYTKKYANNPIEISITGSLFFDKLHYQGNGEIGPSWARGDTYWEIHPISSITFKQL